MMIFFMSVLVMNSALQFSNKSKDPDFGMVEAETKFTDSSLLPDRFNPKSHNYGTVYTKYLLQIPQTDLPHTIVELSESADGLAMWLEVFPQSRLYGFNTNTDHWGTQELIDDSYWKNLDKLKKGGFEDSHVIVQPLEQVINNSHLLQSTFTSKGVRPNIVIDDGLHLSDAGWFTFRIFYPFLADNFVYFIEDLKKMDIDKGLWEYSKIRILEDCAGCKFSFECPVPTKTNECMAVITTY